MGLSVVCADAAPASRGYETGTFSDARALAGKRGFKRLPSRLADSAPSDRSACKQAVYVAGAGAEATTSFARERVASLIPSRAAVLSRRRSRVRVPSLSSSARIPGPRSSRAVTIPVDSAEVRERWVSRARARRARRRSVIARDSWVGSCFGISSRYSVCLSGGVVGGRLRWLVCAS
jgi:hypothetical protein